MAKQFSHGSFETKHFDICPGAVTAFNKSAKEKGVDEKALVKAARAVDKYLGMEKAAQERGSVTDAQMIKFLDSVADAKKEIGDAKLKGHGYHSTHIDAMKRIEKNTKKNLKEGHDDYEDHEADMARAQLMQTAEYAIKLFKMIQPGDNLEGWTASKITKASDYLSSVFHYMEYEAYKEVEKSRMMAMKDVKDEYFDSLENKLTAVKEDKNNQPITEEQFDEAAGKKDACYHKVKSRYKVWPSAYASGALVQCRKVGAKNWGNSKK